MALTDITLSGTYDKVQIAVDRLRMFEPPEGFYLAFSGGKDSIVIKELAVMSGVRFDAHYSVTTIDPPELVRFIRHYYPDVIWDRPARPFLSRLLENGFPIGNKRWCCEEYKEKHGVGRYVLTGIRAEESRKRKNRAVHEPCYNQNKQFIHPIIDWTTSEVWEFIRLRNLPYCSLYDEGFTRIGCIFCPNNYSRRKHVKRWPLYAKQFKRAFSKRYNLMHHRPAYARWKSGDEMFDWWITEKPGKIDPRQCKIFD